MPKAPPPTRGRGRPQRTDRDTIIVTACEQIATGKLVKDVCKKLKCTPGQLREWCAETQEYSLLYARAREEQAHAIAESAVTIADEKCLGSDEVARNRLRVDTRKWMAAKIAPRTYSDRQQIDHGVTDSLASLIAQAGVIPSTVPT